MNKVNPPKQEFITNMEKTIEYLELRVSSMQTELNQLNEERKQLECHQSSLEVDGKILREEKREDEVLQRQVQTLQQINQNLSEDLLEWKTAYQEKLDECELNREKYQRTQQAMEEMRRQLEAKNEECCPKSAKDVANTNKMNMVNERYKEQIGELGHLPYILETKELELQDTHTKLKLAKKTIIALSEDLESCIVKCELLQKGLDQERAKISKFNEEAEAYQNEIKGWKTKYSDLEKEKENLLKGLEKMKFLEECLEAKTRSFHQLTEQLELAKEENAKHVSRIRERADMQRRALQIQVSGLENEVGNLRESLNNAHQDKENIKQRMQAEISKLEQKFNESQIEVQNLRSHVDILKSSYSKMVDELNRFEGDDEFCDLDDDDDDDDGNDD